MEFKKYPNFTVFKAKAFPTGPPPRQGEGTGVIKLKSMNCISSVHIALNRESNTPKFCCLLHRLGEWSVRKKSLISGLGMGKIDTFMVLICDS